MWHGYRVGTYQQSFEGWLQERGFSDEFMHTSGHAKISDIKRLIAGLQPSNVVPVHTMSPESFLEYSEKVRLQVDGVEFEV